MKEKVVIILEIVFILGAFLFYIIKEEIPELKRQYGSSDKIINTKRYQNMIEINIDNNIDFSVIIDNDKRIYHLMFFNKDSVVLYNKNIENNYFDIAIDNIVRNLIENDYLKNNSEIVITKYSDVYYGEFINSFKNILKKYSLNNNIKEDTSNLVEKAHMLNILDAGTSTILLKMDYYSKEMKLLYNTKNNKTINVINKNNSKKYTDNVYKKIEKYILENNIKNLKKNDTMLLINNIPADSDGKYYPTNNSWYYVDNGRVYAYIEIQNNESIYKYCYKGEIDLTNEGECG